LACCFNLLTQKSAAETDRELKVALNPSNGWNVAAIEPDWIQTRYHNDGTVAWFATIKRISTGTRVFTQTRQETFGLSKRMLKKLADCSRFEGCTFAGSLSLQLQNSSLADQH
jgi:hypothetical protein